MGGGGAGGRCPAIDGRGGDGAGEVAAELADGFTGEGAAATGAGGAGGFSVAAAGGA